MVWSGDRLSPVRDSLLRYGARLFGRVEIVILQKDDKDSHKPLFPMFQVPVGRETLGRIMNVIGEPVDECGPIGGWLLLWTPCKLTLSQTNISCDILFL